MASSLQTRKDNADPHAALSASSWWWFWATWTTPLHVGVRIALANRLPIMDCDETFNYWEPLHFLLYQTGFQTWEYSNIFALRTYSYLTPLVGVAKVYQRILEGLSLERLSWMWPLLTDQLVGNNDKVALFMLLRASLGAWMAWAELSFVSAIAEQTLTLKDGKLSGQQQQPIWFLLVALVTHILLLTSAGMGHAAAALLPSSTLMGLWLFAAAAFLRQQHTWFIFLAVTATLAVGWPFGVILFVPLGLRVLMREFYHPKSSMVRLILKIGVIAAMVQAVVMAIDYQHYDRLVSPVWNILLYNTQAGGDELYGVEPLSYYIKNMLLNLNYVAVVGMLGAVLSPLMFASNELWYLLLPMLTWVAVVAPRPHKEERFLFPIYPALCLGAAMLSVFVIQRFMEWSSSPPKNRSSQTRYVFSVVLLCVMWGPAALISGCRIAALMKYYSAPLLLYAELPVAIENYRNSSKTPVRVCTCGEWYRFPSSFYTPSESSAFGFASSTFGGQLPQQFTVHGSGAASRDTISFNDKNEPEPESYTSIHNCDFLVELSTSLESCTERLEEGYRWHEILNQPFLNTEATSTLHRSLYIPWLHEKAVHNGKVAYGSFDLYVKQILSEANN
jgi:alpha-1,2-mannosyltransferase